MQLSNNADAGGLVRSSSELPVVTLPRGTKEEGAGPWEGGAGLVLTRGR